jgi:tetratricopeptide (TPR) repeat protein
MNRFSRFFFSICSYLPFTLSSQEELKMSIALLGNEVIADVNVDQDPFVKGIGQVTELTGKQFKGMEESQKLAMLMVVHKSGKTDFEVHATPALAPEKEKAYLDALRRLSIPNTKLVDFPILLLVHADLKDLASDFKNLELPADKADAAYMKAELKEKMAMNKAYAAEQALPVLSAYEIIVDKEFAGVKGLGTTIRQKDFKKTQDVSALTSHNNDYWRANLEMSVGNQLIPVTKIAMLMSQGEFDHAMKYMEIVHLFAEPKSVAAAYLKEMLRRLKEFNKALQSKINTGIAEHDKGNYEKAIAIYKDILSQYPNSAAAKYELYYSQNALDLKNKTVTTSDRKLWDESKASIYQSNPLYPMDVRAGSGKEMYLLFRRQATQSLFKEEKKTMKDVYTYADIAMDLGVYDFAAQLFWLSITYDKDQEGALSRFLYCLEKLNVKTMREHFKGDFEKTFRDLEKEKQEEMENDPMYKSFKK